VQKKIFDGEQAVLQASKIILKSLLISSSRRPPSSAKATPGRFQLRTSKTEMNAM
jgi:hypothetical protein